ncbi:hypothetical protein D3C75_1010310 [compost metagenome]
MYTCREEDALALPLAAEARASYAAAAGNAAGDSAARAASAGAAAEPPVELFADGSGHPEDAGAVRWINREDMANYAFPNVFLKLLNRYFDEAEQQEL